MKGKRFARIATTAFAVVALGAGVAACGDDDDGGGGGGGGGGEGKAAKIALLLPETKTARYESQDRPNFERKVKELCSNCEIVYSNADQDPAKQLTQVEAAISQQVARAFPIVSLGRSTSLRSPRWSRIAPVSNMWSSPSTNTGTWPNGCSRK